MAATDPESLIQVLSVGVERVQEFPRTNHHLAKARGMHLLQHGWNWGSEAHLDGLKPNSHGQSTDVLASEEPLFFGHLHLSEPHSSLCSGNGRGEEWGSSWPSEEDFALCSPGGKCPWTLWRAWNTTLTNIWHRNSGWVLQCGEEHQGCWGGQGISNVYSQEKPFQEPHSLILPPEMWGHKAHICPEQSFSTPPLLQ